MSLISKKEALSTFHNSILSKKLGQPAEADYPDSTN